MKVLVTGAHGQAGQAVIANSPGFAQVTALGHEALDVTDEHAVSRAIAEIRPDWVVNAAAYTAVDAAESDTEAAFALNAEAVAILARATARSNGRLLHLSTDFVFDGRASEPYAPGAATSPINVYGRSKLLGEQHARELAPESIVLRTSWLYAKEGRNFVNTMLRLMRSRREIGVVCDQVGAPTSATGLAKAIWRLIELNAAPAMHQWSDSGVASWYDFAVAIAEEAQQRQLLTSAPAVSPIRSREYPTAASRPPYSVLDCRTTRTVVGLPPTHWRVNLRKLLDVLATE